jgi:mannose-6-phosphate isomerase-like protein (cupin superfamily)
VEVLGIGATEPFVTLDGSEIREWAGRVSLPASNLSLAQATIAVGAATTEHLHRVSEELYLVTQGSGRLRLDGEERMLQAGDCALIPPGTRHKIFNVGDAPLQIVCACAPPYSDADTQLTE